MLGTSKLLQQNKLLCPEEVARLVRICIAQRAGETNTSLYTFYGTLGHPSKIPVNIDVLSDSIVNRSLLN